VKAFEGDHSQLKVIRCRTGSQFNGLSGVDAALNISLLIDIITDSKFSNKDIIEDRTTPQTLRCTTL